MSDNCQGGGFGALQRGSRCGLPPPVNKRDFTHMNVRFSGVKRTSDRHASMSANDPKRTLQSRCALRILDLAAPTIERAKTMLLSIKTKRCATNDARGRRRLSLDQASDRSCEYFFLRRRR